MNQAIYDIIMLDTNSKNENAGAVINEIELTPPTTVRNLDIQVCLYIITALIIIKFIYTAYKLMQKNFKKKYSNVVVV